MTLADPTPEEREVLADALDAFQQAERYGASLTIGAERDRKFGRARVASKLLTEAQRG